MSAVRQYLREWLKDGAEKAAPCTTQVAVDLCFVPLMRWVLTLWRGSELALAVDVTNHFDRLHVLCISVVYRGCAIPVAWHIMPGGTKGAWMPHLCRMLHTLAEAIPSSLSVLVLMDAGLRSPRLWEAATSHGWHPLQRHEQHLSFRPAGYHSFHRADTLVSRPGEAWVGTGVAFKTRKARRPATLVVVWEKDHAAPWVLLTDLAAQDVGLLWYGLRFWIECGFRIIKGMGWQWQKSRRTDGERVARHWLVMAVASCWTVAAGTRVEEAESRGRLPDRLHAPAAGKRPAVDPMRRTRPVSIFRLGLNALRDQCARARLWRCLWLAPEPWPEDPPGLAITRLIPSREAA
jgi:Transposase DDE domain